MRRSYFLVHARLRHDGQTRLAVGKAKEDAVAHSDDRRGLLLDFGHV